MSKESKTETPKVDLSAGKTEGTKVESTKTEVKQSSPEELAKKVEQLDKDKAELVAKITGLEVGSSAWFTESQKLAAKIKEINKINSAPKMEELKVLKQEMDDAISAYKALESELVASGVIESTEQKEKKPRGEGPGGDFWVQKYSTNGCGRFFANLIKKAGVITEETLNRVMQEGKFDGTDLKQTYKPSGVTDCALRGLRDLYHVIDFQPGNPRTVIHQTPGQPEVVRTYTWTATQEALDKYNSVLKEHEVAQVEA